MSIKIKYLCLLCLILFTRHLGLTQSFIENPTVIKDNGLPSNTITAITKDNNGFIWIATPDGLSRWDGLKIKTFLPQRENTNSIPAGFRKKNTLLWDDNNKRLILGTIQGLSFYYTERDSFENYLVNIDNLNALHDFINAVYIDRQNTLWIATNSGFAKYNEKNKNFDNYIFSDKLPKNNVFSYKRINIIQDIKQDINNDSILWISNLGGLFSFNKYTENISYFYLENKSFSNILNQLRDILVHPNGNLYIKTWNADMVIFNTITHQYINHIGPYANRKKDYFENTVIPNTIKSKTQIFISSKSGIGTYNIETGQINIIKQFKNKAGHKILLDILYTDNQGIWCGSEYGLFFFKYSRGQIENYIINTKNYTRFYIPATIVENPNSNILYLGYKNSDGLHFFNMSNKKLDVSTYPLKYDSQYNIRDIITDSKNRHIAITRNGIYKINAITNRMSPYFNIKNIPDFTSIIQDNNNNIWVSGHQKGIQKVDLVHKKLISTIDWEKIYKHTKDKPHISKMICDKNDRIWFSDYISYGYYDIESGKVKLFEDNKTKMQVFCFAGFVNDTIWVGTSGWGLGYILPQDPDAGIHLDTLSNDKLNGNSIFSIEKDRKDRFWLLTNAGLEMLSSNRKKSLYYGINEGLWKYDDWTNRDPSFKGKLQVLSSGQIAIQYRRGLGLFYPDSLKVSENKFKVYLFSLKANNITIISDNLLNRNDIVYFKYNQDNIEINYSVLSTNSIQNFQLYHKLSSIDDEWVKSRTGIVSYANLAPGKYTMYLKAQNNAIIPMIDENSFEFVINPPWWATWWAYLLYFLFGITLFYLFHRYYYKRKFAQKENKRLRELDELKNRFYQNITHEFRTPLTVIKGLTNEVLNNINTSEKKKFSSMLHSIGRNSDRLMALVNQILDLAKIENKKLKLNFTCSDIIDLIKIVTESFHSLAKQKNIEFVYYNEIDELCMDFDKEKITIIISNLLSNAIKFTPEYGKIILHIKKESSKSGKDELIIKIKDSGIGISKEDKNRIFERFYQAKKPKEYSTEGTGIGLSIVKEYVKLMKGNINIESEIGKGSIFTIRLAINSISQKDNSISPKIIPENNKIDEFHIQKHNIKDVNNNILLIVEDNIDVANYIATCVDKNHKIIYAKDGEEGIIKAIEYIPDIIITDLMMPKKDGFELCEVLKNDIKTSHIPIIMLTARSMEEDKLKGYKVGADAYLIKPFNKNELNIRLEQLIKLRRKLQKKYNGTFSLPQKSESPEELFLSKLFLIIDKHISEINFKSANLASQIGLSESQLYRKIKSLTDKSTAIFIREYRLNKAASLLKTTNLTIAEIAYDTGFSDPAYFSKVFKLMFNITPGQFRN